MVLQAKSRARWLPLLRPAGALTAGADVAAGWAIAGSGDWLSGATLILASVCMYAGGVALNDVCDAVEDARLRSERPIPSGAITRKRAVSLAVALLLLGVALAFLASIFHSTASRLVPEPVNVQQTFGWTNLSPGFVALALVATIVLYNSVLKRSALFGPVSMGACRGLNLILGMSVGASALGVWWPLALGHVAHIAGVTAMARHETDEPAAHHPNSRTNSETARIKALSASEGSRQETEKENNSGSLSPALSQGRGGQRLLGVGAAIFLTCLTLIGWTILAFVSPRIDAAWTMVFLAVFGASVFPSMLAAFRSPEPQSVRRAVGRGVLGLVALDAAIAAGFASPVYGLFVLCVWPVSYRLGRRFAIS